MSNNPEPRRTAYSRQEAVNKMNEWMEANQGHPMKLESDQRDRWYRDNGLIHAFLCAIFPIEPPTNPKKE